MPSHRTLLCACLVAAGNCVFSELPQSLCDGQRRGTLVTCSEALLPNPFLTWAGGLQAQRGPGSSWLGSPGFWVPANQRPIWGSPGGSPWPASRKLRVLGSSPEREERGLLYASDCPHDYPGTMGTHTASCHQPPPSCSGPAAHLPSLPVGTLGICQLQSHAVCPVLSGPLAPGCVGWANRATGSLSSPQSHRPVKPDAGPGRRLLYCLPPSGKGAQPSPI